MIQLISTFVAASTLFVASEQFVDEPSWAGKCVQIEFSDPLQDLQGYLFENDRETALKVAHYFAKHGEVDHMRSFGFLLYLNNPEKKSRDELEKDVLMWFEKSANCGHIQAQEDLVNMLTSSTGEDGIFPNLPLARCIENGYGTKDLVTKCKRKINAK